MRIECPNCSTSYSSERCGLNIKPFTEYLVTVACLVCKHTFDTAITWNEGQKASDPTWWARVVRGEVQLKEIEPFHEFVSSKRAESKGIKDVAIAAAVKAVDVDETKRG